jgi:hypothetical protein
MFDISSPSEISDDWRAKGRNGGVPSSEFPSLSQKSRQTTHWWLVAAGAAF